MTHPDLPNDELEAQIREHYAAQSLSGEKLAHLKAVARGEVVPEPTAAPRPLLGGWLAPTLKVVVAAALLVAALGPYLGWWGPHKPTPRALAHQIAVEVALNHTKQLALDFNASTWAALSAPERELDFTPIKPEIFDSQKEVRLLGARFATVGGQMALQVRLVDTDHPGDSSAVYTLYQLRPGEAFAPIRGKYAFDVHGVRVVIWRERDLILGLAMLSPTLH